MSLDGTYEKIIGKPFGFKNVEGDASIASFSKPNGIAASLTGDTLYINVSEPSWRRNPSALYPAGVMMVTGICTLPDSECEYKYQLSEIVFEEVDVRAIYELEVRSLHKQIDGSVWIGTRTQGVFKWSNDHYYRVSGNNAPEGAISIIEDDEGDVWLAGRGLWKVAGNVLSTFSESYTGNRVNFNLGITEDGIMIASGSSGLISIRGNTINEKIDTAIGLPHPVVHDAYYSQGTWWLATRKAGLNRYANGKWESFLPQVNCRKIMNLSESKLLIGAGVGLIEFDILTNEYSWLIREGFSVMPMTSTSKGEVYCVAESKGLWKLRRGKISKVKLEGNPVIYDVVEVGSRLMLGTSEGIIWTKIK